jgi:replicative DNA helicase
MWPDPETSGRRGFLGGLLGLVAVSFLRPRGKATDDHVEDPVPEVATLGALMQRPQLLSEVERVVEAWMFRGRRTSAVFRWMVDQRRRGRPHDLRAAVLAARSSGGPGAARVLVNWLEEVPNCDSAVAYAECVRVQRPGVFAALERRLAIRHL